MFYRLNKKNNIIDYAPFKYGDDCLETNKNIIRSFDGRLIFEEETKTQEYLTAKQEFDFNQNKEKEILQIKKQLQKYTEDFIQESIGAVIPNIENKKIEFINLHNRLRTLEGKEARVYIKKV